MICKYCGANFRIEELKYCPYCDMEIPAEERAKENPRVLKKKEWDLDKLTEVRVLAAHDPYTPYGTVKVTVVGNPKLTSPASGANYIMTFDANAYQVRLTKGDLDISEFVELPVGHHEGILKYYAWHDSALKKPETNRNDIITIDVRENCITEVLIKTGTILIPRTISVRYYREK